MSRKKHTPARLHWERIAARKANGVNTVETAKGEYCGYRGVFKVLQRNNRPANAKPGQ